MLSTFDVMATVKFNSLSQIYCLVQSVIPREKITERRKIVIEYKEVKLHIYTFSCDSELSLKKLYCTFVVKQEGSVFTLTGVKFLGCFFDMVCEESNVFMSSELRDKMIKCLEYNFRTCANEKFEIKGIEGVVDCSISGMKKNGILQIAFVYDKDALNLADIDVELSDVDTDDIFKRNLKDGTKYTGESN